MRKGSRKRENWNKIENGNVKKNLEKIWKHLESEKDNVSIH